MSEEWQALTRNWLITHHLAKEEIRKKMINDLVISEHGNILDAGCGVGNFTILLANHSSCPRHVLGIDNNSENLESAQLMVKNNLTSSNQKIEWLHHDIRELQFLKEFDLVWCANTLQYFENPIEIIELLKSMVKKNGLLVIKDEDVMRDILLSWDPEFELAITNAWYQIASSMEGRFWDPFLGRKLFGLLNRDKTDTIRTKTYLCEYTYPLPDVVVQYITKAFVGYSLEYRKYLSDKHWITFQNIFNSNHKDYLFSRNDLHFISTETVVAVQVR
jgi:ubiquinone/menaquinone biosynthesis C-methylase UbiE